MKIKTSHLPAWLPRINQQTTSAGENVASAGKGTQTGTATVEDSMEFPQKMKLPFDPAIPLLGIYTKNPETPI